YHRTNIDRVLADDLNTAISAGKEIEVAGVGRRRFVKMCFDAQPSWAAWHFILAETRPSAGSLDHSPRCEYFAVGVNREAGFASNAKSRSLLTAVRAGCLRRRPQ